MKSMGEITVLGGTPQFNRHRELINTFILPFFLSMIRICKALSRKPNCIL